MVPEIETKIIFVIGGCRSGKSRYAQELAEAAARRRVYVATCVPMDPEMIERVKRHQAERDHTWITVEAPVDVSKAIRSHSRPDTVLLVDCLTLWITNMLLETENPDPVKDRVRELAETLGTAAGPVIMVSNEVGQGIVPENRLARLFRDCAGRANQTVAACADRVIWMAAGIPMPLKPAPWAGEST